MDPGIATVVAAGITALASLVVAIVQHHRKKTADKRNKRKDAVIGEALKHSAERAAYEVSEFDTETTFDDAGRCSHVRKWRGVRANQTITNLEIPCLFSLSAGADTEMPQAEAIENSKLTARFVVKETTHDSNRSTVGGVVVLDGLISPDVQPVNFVVTQVCRNPFALTEEEAVQRYKGDEWTTEYAASSITVPARVLRRTVKFPASHRDRISAAQAVVFWGETGEVVDEEETARVRTALVTSSESATLVVQDPKVGFRYAVAWMPPKAPLEPVSDV